MPKPKVLLVGWDAADWKVIHPLIDAGKMPNVQRLVENGVMAQMATIHPVLSPMLWTSIATGKRPFKHGIHGFSEPAPDGQAVQPVTNLSRNCKAVWNILNQNGLRSIVVGWWPSHPAEPIRGVMVSDHYHRAHGPLEKGWPLRAGAVHPPELAETLAELRMHPEELASPMLQAFVADATKIDQMKDRRLLVLAKIICECVSIHSAATWLLDNQPWDFFAVYYDAIDHFSHAFMRYHPPRQAWIKEEDFERYRNVVSMAYQFHDQMLGTLLQKAGEDVRVVLMSDHGFHPDHLRPRAIPDIPAGPAIEHRDFGIFVMSGPGIRRDELLHGAGVLDVAPTLLSLFDLPVGADMDGKPLAGAFEQPPEPKTIPTWEDVPGEDGRHPPHTRLDPVAARDALEQLVALGYIERPGPNRERAVARTVRELRYNLCEAYQDANRHAEAIEIARELYRDDPDEVRFAVKLFVSSQALGYRSEMRRIVDDLDGRRRELFEQAREHLAGFREMAKQRIAERRAARQALSQAAEPEDTEIEGEELEKWRRLARYQPPLIDYLKAQVLAADHKFFDALAHLQRVQDAHLLRPGLLLQTGDLLGRLRRWEEAEQTYTKALDIDPDNAHAHLGMCRVALWRRDYAAAARSALACIRRIYEHPMGHFLLGIALTGSGDCNRAVQAFRAALSLNPNFPQAHLRLYWLFKRRLNDPAAAEEHRRYYRDLRSRRTSHPERPSPDEPSSASETASTRAATRNGCALPPLGSGVLIVSGLPRSGTSMIMQMLVAGGMPILTDGVRQADDDNPKGYFEYEPVRTLLHDPSWMSQACGKAVRVVAPLLEALPPGLAYRVILIERDLDEILSSQAEMIARRGESVPDTLERRARLKEEYSRLVEQVKAALSGRPKVELLALRHDAVLNDPGAAAHEINLFAGGGLAEADMAATVDRSLHRQRAKVGRRHALP